jgi:hypothetical protein
VAEQISHPTGDQMFIKIFDPNAIYKEASDDLHKFVTLAVVALATTAVTTLVKWVQDHGHNRRGEALTARIAALAKMISELPELPTSTPAPAITPRTALSAELDSAVHELTALQERATATAGRRFSGFSFASTIDRTRSAFLLYRPKGPAAWTLHLAFYVYLAFYILSISAVLDSGGSQQAATGDKPSPQVTQTTPARGTNTAKSDSAPAKSGTIPDVPAELNTVPNLFAFLFIFGALAIPPTVIRHYAARLHNQKCVPPKVANKPVKAGPKTPEAPTAQEAI